MDDDAQKASGAAGGRDGRRRCDLPRERLVAACLAPGVSVSRLALEHGVNANLVRKWIRLAKQAGPVLAAAAFVPVQIVADMHSGSAGDPITEKGSIGKRSQASKISTVLPNGVSLAVECSDVDGLAAIIGALAHV